MEISEEQLMLFLSRALKLFHESIQEEEKPKKKACIIFSKKWDERYEQFFENFQDKDCYDLYGIIEKDALEDERFCRLLTVQCSKIIEAEKALKDNDINEDITIIPLMHRDILAKAALCIPDTFETAWMERSFRQGKKIKIWSRGIESFTGKEPEAYKEKILSYIRTLLEFGIEIEVNEER